MIIYVSIIWVLLFINTLCIIYVVKAIKDIAKLRASLSHHCKQLYKAENKLSKVQNFLTINFGISIEEFISNNWHEKQSGDFKA